MSVHFIILSLLPYGTNTISTTVNSCFLNRVFSVCFEESEVASKCSLFCYVNLISCFLIVYYLSIYLKESVFAWKCFRILQNISCRLRPNIKNFGPQSTFRPDVFFITIITYHWKHSDSESESEDEEGRRKRRTLASFISQRKPLKVRTWLYFCMIYEGFQSWKKITLFLSVLLQIWMKTKFWWSKIAKLGNWTKLQMFSYYVRYSTLLHLPPLRFNCVGVPMQGSNPWQFRVATTALAVWRSTTRLDLTYKISSKF